MPGKIGKVAARAPSAAEVSKAPNATAFDKIAAGLEDAIAYAGGDVSRGRVATVDAKAVRKVTGLTQAGFASTFHFPVGTVRDWEQGRRQPDTGSATLLKMIAADPKAVESILAKVE